MAYSALSIANYFIEKAAEVNEFLTPLKVIKLVYIAHGWHLAITEKPLIKEQVEAWQYGPVVPILYQNLKKIGHHIIKCPIKLKGNALNDDAVDEDSEVVMLLDKVWAEYRRFGALQLSTLTHEEGTPWQETYCGSYSNATISNDIIKEYYRKKINS
jgi:uncharacterized phage-associated protein